jgi:polysaccharide export outer membrane protein
MPISRERTSPRRLRFFLLIASTLCGCETTKIYVAAPLPKELEKVSHPVYVIEPPDILQIELVSAIPKPPYRIRPLDVLTLTVPNALPEAPLSGLVTVETDGMIYLGSSYGAVTVAGLTMTDARTAVEEYLGKFIKKPLVNIALAQTRATQQIRGPHLVRADGTIGLGSYNSVRVTGLTLREAKQAIEDHLRNYFQDPEVSLEIVGYNSKVYYVIYDAGAAGQQVTQFPITGNETVLDAVARMNGLATYSDSRQIWISRPSPNCEVHQVLPVNWKAISEQGNTDTNYQLFPGDRIFVKAYPLVAANNRLSRVIAPLEQLLGVTLLGAGTVQAFGPNGGNGFGVP